jgi:hypothetical protein
MMRECIGKIAAAILRASIEHAAALSEAERDAEQPLPLAA